MQTRDVTVQTSLAESTWLTSAATPGAPRISYKLKAVTKGSCLSNSDKGWPIPPPAPRTATLVKRAEEVENRREEDESDFAAVRASIFCFEKDVQEDGGRRKRDAGPRGK